MIPVSSCSCLCPIHWSQVLSREWRCSWSSADRRCSNYIWMIKKCTMYQGVTYIRGLTILKCVWNSLQFQRHLWQLPELKHSQNARQWGYVKFIFRKANQMIILEQSFTFLITEFQRHAVDLINKGHLCCATNVIISPSVLTSVVFVSRLFVREFVSFGNTL